MSTAVQLPLGPGIYLDVPEAIYHADPCAVPSLSSSIAHTLLSKCPAHAYLRHPKLGGSSYQATKSMNDGSVIHAILLGNEGSIARIDHADYRTSAAKEARDAATESGKTPVLVERLVELREAATAIRGKLAARGIVLDGVSEATMVWRELSPFGDVTCRGRVDHLRLAAGQIIDLKSSVSAHPRACKNHVIEYGYDVQAAAYPRGLEALHPELEGRVEFLHVFFEIEPPYCTTAIHLSGQFRQLGRAKWGRAVNAWGRCVRDNVWPDYEEGTLELAPPPWALADELVA